MLDFIRRHSRLLMILLFVLGMPSFLFSVVADQGFSVTEDRIATINKQNITQSEFNHSWTNRLHELRTSQGANFDIAQVDTPAAREAWLNGLIDAMVIQETAIQDKFSAPESLVRQTIAQLPQAQENGRFSMDAYNRFLTGIGASALQYENSVRRNEAIGLVINPIADSVVMPAKTVKALGDAMSEERQVRLRWFNNEAFINGIQVSEEELSKWYEENKTSFEIPEYVNLDYILLNQEAAVAQVNTPSDAELESYYQSNIRRFSEVERRHIRHIQVDTLEKAQEVALKAKQDPTQFEALAKEYSLDNGTKNTGGDLGLLQRGQISTIDEAVFTPKETGITDPIQLGNNYHVFQIVSIQGGTVKPFAEVKEEIAKEVRLQLASDRFATMATDLTRLAQENHDSLQAIADALGLKVQQVDGISRSGLLPKAQAGAKAALGSEVERFFTLPRVREDVFSAEMFTQGLNSGVIEASPAELLVIRIRDKVEKHIPPLAKVTQQASFMMLNEKAHALAEQTGQKVLEQAQLDQTQEGFGTAVGISRFTTNLPEALLNQIMTAPVDKLPHYIGLSVNNAYVIARIEGVTADKQDLKDLFTQYQAPMLDVVLGNEVSKDFTANLRKMHKVEILPLAKTLLEEEQQ
ncbi:hypothetical protein F9B74_03625 [Pelistega sp. NLN82]|uniref:Periplasmic chaperone PpiD n=1 Tax=Pelistega ratti TaxID=2652177 RepID=A0A6L9Y579_9BURK|nr:SurA N-terminal domain-containing protein [Pelistega ratti]NEN75416.1 hypothetical protein [Pelistega ratti]